MQCQYMRAQICIPEWTSNAYEIGRGRSKQKISCTQFNVDDKQDENKKNQKRELWFYFSISSMLFSVSLLAGSSMKSLKSELNMLSADEGDADGGDGAETEAGEAVEEVEAAGAVDEGGGAAAAVAVAVADEERVDEGTDAMAGDELEVAGDAANGAASDGGEDASAGTGAGAGAGASACA